MKNTLFQYWKLKEAEWERSITIKEISEATGLSRNTIKNLRDGDTTRYDNEVIDAFCKFFKVPKGPIPFFEYIPD